MVTLPFTMDQTWRSATIISTLSEQRQYVVDKQIRGATVHGVETASFKDQIKDVQVNTGLRTPVPALLKSGIHRPEPPFFIAHTVSRCSTAPSSTWSKFPCNNFMRMRAETTACVDHRR